MIFLIFYKKKIYYNYIIILYTTIFHSRLYYSNNILFINKTKLKQQKAIEISNKIISQHILYIYIIFNNYNKIGVVIAVYQFFHYLYNIE